MKYFFIPSPLATTHLYRFGIPLKSSWLTIFSLLLAVSAKFFKSVTLPFRLGLSINLLMIQPSIPFSKTQHLTVLLPKTALDTATFESTNLFF